MYLTPSGEYIIAELPKEVQRTHYGSGVHQYIAYQTAKNRVTQKRLCQDLNDKGLQISEGQIDQIAKAIAKSLKSEKDDLLHVGARYSEELRTDDTGARHRGKNGSEYQLRFDLENEANKPRYIYVTI